MASLLKFNVTVVRSVNLQRTKVALVIVHAKDPADAALATALLLGETSWTWNGAKWDERTRNPALSDVDVASWFFVEAA